MKYVELVEQLRWRTGTSARKITSLEDMPENVERLKRWISEAWESIQREQTAWFFRRESGVHTLALYSNVIDSPEFQAGQTFEWLINTVRLSDPGKGRGDSTPVPCIPYDDFINGEGLNPANYGKPNCCAVRPMDKALIIAPSADAAYPVYYDYIRSVQTLVADDDVPIMPKEFHLLIVYEAMMTYAEFDSAAESYQSAKRNRLRLRRDLMSNQLPPMTIGGGMS